MFKINKNLLINNKKSYKIKLERMNCYKGGKYDTIFNSRYIVNHFSRGKSK